MSTKVCRSIPWTGWILSAHLNSLLKSTLISSYLLPGLAGGLVPSGFPTKHALYQPHQFRSPLFDRPTNTWWTVRTVGLLQPPVTSFLVQCSRQHPVLRALLICVRPEGFEVFTVMREATVCVFPSKRNGNKRSPSSICSWFLHECSFVTVLPQYLKLSTLVGGAVLATDVSIRVFFRL